ncbi:MAG: flavin reductase family protein [Pseudomonadota bacterium]
MFYRPGIDAHGLPHNPFGAIVAPRPIGWISTVDDACIANLAPYSFFNAVAYTPPMVMYSSTGAKLGAGERKDTLANIRATGEFVVNIVPEALRDAMNRSAQHAPAGIDEFAAAGLEKAPSTVVGAPRVAGAPAALECTLWQVVELPGGESTVVFGEVVGIHIDDDAIVDGMVDPTRYRPLARLGYHDYAAVREVFAMRRPDEA